MSVRMKLSDFINTDNEVEIMEIINKTHKDLRAVIFLHLWYENDEINAVHLKDFLIRWEDKLHFKTVVKEGTNVTSDEFIFFDILPKGEKQADWSRFSYRYENKKSIVNGLKELYNCVKFITSDKPTKRQKRNDYED